MKNTTLYIRSWWPAVIVAAAMTLTALAVLITADRRTGLLAWVVTAGAFLYAAISLIRRRRAR